MPEQRPFGSYDWNHNGEYDLFDKITDRYVYTKVLEHMEKQKRNQSENSQSNGQSQRYHGASVTGHDARKPEVSGVLEYVLEDLQKNKKFVIEAEKINWNEAYKKQDLVFEISLTQYKKCLEYREKILEVLEGHSEEEKKQICNQILRNIDDMCRESQKMFSDYTGYETLFQAAQVLVLKDQSRAEELLGVVKNADETYKIMAGMQVKSASELKAALDDKKLLEQMLVPKEWQNCLFRLGKAYNSVVYAAAERYGDFFLIPSEDFIEELWHEYGIMLEGLSQRDIDLLDESGWMLMLDIREKNGDGAYKKKFLEVREQIRKQKCLEEKEMKQKKYWENHPELLQKIADLEHEIQDIENQIVNENNKARILASKRKPYVLRQEERRRKIEDLDNEIKIKEKRWWKRKKDREEIQDLQRKLEKVETEEQEDRTKNVQIEIEWQDQERKLEELKAECRKKQSEVEKIRHSDEDL